MKMRHLIAVIAAGVQAEHKFLRKQQPEGYSHLAQQTADKVVQDAGREQEELGHFFEEVKTSTSQLAQQLQNANERIQELEQEDQKSKEQLQHAKQAFKDQIKQVEVKLVEKVHRVEQDNADLRQQLERANLNVQLHSKAEQDLKGRIQEMGRVFSNQEQTVKSILTASTNVQQALKAQDQSKSQSSEETSEQSSAETSSETSSEDDELALEPEVEKEKVEPSAEAPKPEPVADAKPAPAEKPAPAKAAPEVKEAKAEAKDDDDKSPLDSLASEVDTLASEADDKKSPEPKGRGFAGAQQATADLKTEVEATVTPTSSDLLDGANDELTSLLKQ